MTDQTKPAAGSLPIFLIAEKRAGGFSLHALRPDQDGPVALDMASRDPRFSRAWLAKAFQSVIGKALA